jgi:hypothetical protein
VHLRRALLLFAIVLGLAAVAASVPRPRGGSDQVGTPPPTTEVDRPPTASPAPDGSLPALELTFLADDPRAQRIRAGQAATVYVEVDEPGQVAIADLGMSAAAEPLTPARFDVLTPTTGRHPITFTPAAEEDVELRAGTLVVVAE